MKNDHLKYIFYTLSGLLLCFMVLASRKAGVSCDEMLHYNHSQSVYRYFGSYGTDRSALNTPVSNLKYYGQSFDNVVTILSNWCGVDNVYAFRSLMSSVAGWITILLTALFASRLSGYRSAIFVVLLFGISPAFLGHSQNNLKDVPFALSYIASAFFIIKFLPTEKRISLSGILLIIFSIAFSISIRAGGLVLICYIYFFFFVLLTLKFIETRNFDKHGALTRLLQIMGITTAAWFLSILLWPYALQDPVKNVIGSYRVMAHFPSTFRQIFEGRNEWSDFMPWYYLPKSMLITIPVIVLTGLLLFVLLAKQRMPRDKITSYCMIIFTILFPAFFVIIEKSNLYSSWRQFLFLYPGLVLLAATGFNYLFETLKRSWMKWAGAAFLAILFIHPAGFMLRNMPYSYIYYNQFVGGVRGALGNYETDYYYISHREASEWLAGYLEKKNAKPPVKIGATYSIDWFFRNNPAIETSVFRNEERSQHDWDYAIIVNRYITPFQLKNGMWPPKNAIHIIYADSVPLCAVLERKTKADFNGFTALNEGRNSDAINYFEKALKTDDADEMIFYNFALALYNEKQYLKADSVLKKAVDINPEFEPALMYLGNIAKSNGRSDEAVMYYERVLKADRKYFEAYVSLAELVGGRDIHRARSLLETCLTINPGFRPAIVAMADTYRNTDPEIARRYDELANKIK
jgi:hypothetical protein